MSHKFLTDDSVKIINDKENLIYRYLGKTSDNYCILADVISNKIKFECEDNIISYFLDINDSSHSSEDFHMTIKELKELIEDLPDDGIVFYERIEDKYFNERGWREYTQSVDDDASRRFVKAFTGGYSKNKKHLLITAHY